MTVTKYALHCENRLWQPKQLCIKINWISRNNKQLHFHLLNINTLYNESIYKKRLFSTIFFLTEFRLLRSFCQIWRPIAHGYIRKISYGQSGIINTYLHNLLHTFSWVNSWHFRLTTIYSKLETWIIFLSNQFLSPFYYMVNPLPSFRNKHIVEKKSRIVFKVSFPNICSGLNPPLFWLSSVSC